MGADAKRVRNKACAAQPPSRHVLLFRNSPFSYKVCKTRGTFMLTDNLSPWFILSPGAPNCTYCMLASSKPAGSLGQNPRGRKINIRPQGYRGAQAKGPPSRQPALSPAPPTSNTLCSKPRVSLAWVASQGSRVGPEKHATKFLLISMRSNRPSPDAPNIPARCQCSFFRSWLLLQQKTRSISLASSGIQGLLPGEKG